MINNRDKHYYGNAKINLLAEKSQLRSKCETVAASVKLAGFSDLIFHFTDHQIVLLKICKHYVRTWNI